jgi:hypothetical protein
LDLHAQATAAFAIASADRQVKDAASAKAGDKFKALLTHLGALRVDSAPAKSLLALMKEVVALI